ncbi:hypothetical protein OSB04_011642 [Centaurea solstitialis]|uniref:Gag/pol protein n=1 Tax=Centaurea solstitialis TaxID=347529 RepID=A0AA38THD6_9ASTR|nr:hypothetical protein OSB04_011642 [Centaurea solstitialis]
MMSRTTLPKSFWGYALETAARILNSAPTKKTNKTPFELWTGKMPKVSYMKIWGCEAYVKREASLKLDLRMVTLRNRRTRYEEDETPDLRNIIAS